MEIGYIYCLPELGGIEAPTLFDQYYPMDSFECPLDDFDFESFTGSPESNSSYNQFMNSESTPNCFPAESPIRPTKRLKKYNNLDTCETSHDLISHKVSASPFSKLISFENFNAPSQYASQQFHHNLDIENNNYPYSSESMDFAAFVSHEDKGFLSSDNRLNQIGVTTRNPIQAQEHVMAERKRREKLSQRFIALSAILPGLKKMDKASVLGDAIKYVKQLQERVESLEEQATKRTTGSSSVLLKRSILFADENSDSHCDHSVHEIEVRISGKDVLIRTQSDKHSGQHAAMILSELEKLHFTVQSSSFLPFGNNNVDITIIAQMNKENCTTAKDLLGRLRQALRQLI